MFSQLYNANTIADRVKELASTISRDFKDAEHLHVIVTMNGSFMFAADLIRHIKVPLIVHFMGISSYENSECKTLSFDAKALPPSFGEDPVLIVEDVIDNGDTLSTLRQIIADRHAQSINTVALLKRQGGSAETDYHGFTIPKGMFVVGYGMDMDGEYRELSELQAIEGVMESGVC